MDVLGEWCSTFCDGTSEGRRLTTDSLVIERLLALDASVGRLRLLISRCAPLRAA